VAQVDHECSELLSCYEREIEEKQGGDECVCVCARACVWMVGENERKKEYMRDWIREDQNTKDRVGDVCEVRMIRRVRDKKVVTSEDDS
jgi:hypothetical protein